jgi:hypothetical protein
VMMTLLAALLQAVPAPAPSRHVELPRWLAGCWQAPGEGGATTEECWTAPRGSMLLGSSHSYEDGRTNGFEHMRIISEQGGLAFYAQPSGAPPTRFAATSMTSISGEETLVFVNDGHNYPQRITYRYTHARHWEMTAEISMLDGSRPQRWEFRRPGQ